MDRDTVIVVNGDGMGRAETALTHKLLVTYLGVLEAGGHRPAAILFYAEGVRLAVTGSPVLEGLRALAGAGVELIVCTTCLNHLGILDELAVGTAAGMKEIVDAQAAAAKVVTL